MSKSQKLRDSEIRAVYRLLSDLREMRHDRPALHRHLIETLGTMVGATGGFAADIADWRPGGTPQLESFTPTTNGLEVVAQALRTLAANNNLWDDPTFTFGIHHTGPVDSVPFHELVSPQNLKHFPLTRQMQVETGHVDHLVAWHQKRPPNASEAGPAGDIFGVSMHRYGKKEKLFAGREIAIARLLFEELHWLHTTGRLASPGPDRDALPARQRAVLDLLLDGLAPKQIAPRLNMSLHTVRDHIRRLYERFDVDGREALTAKFLRAVRK